MQLPSWLASLFTVPSADSTANVSLRDVVGNKTDTKQATITTTDSLMGYAKGLIDVVQGYDLVLDYGSRAGNSVGVTNLVSVSSQTGILTHLGLWHHDITGSGGTARFEITVDGGTQYNLDIFTGAGSAVTDALNMYLVNLDPSSGQNTHNKNIWIPMHLRYRTSLTVSFRVQTDNGGGGLVHRFTSTRAVKQ